jgi:hypothetical protein
MITVVSSLGALRRHATSDGTVTCGPGTAGGSRRDWTIRTMKERIGAAMCAT